MNLLRTGRNITIIALLLSLLFHTSTVLYIFLQKKNRGLHSTQEESDLNKILQQQKKDTAWVETKARAGNFGAPVFFEDEPEKTTFDDIQEELHAKNNISDPESNDHTIKIPPHREAIQSAANKIQTMPTAEKSIEHSTIRQQKTSKPKASLNKRAARQKNPFTNYPTQQNNQRQPLTLAQLTQGFLNQPKENSGAYGISMLGKKSGIPSDEQMKYERYLQKLSWCLENSFNIHKYNQPQLSDDTEIYLFFQLNRDGMLEQLNIKKSSGCKILDNFVIFVFREASQSFPPVPCYIPDNPFRMNYLISIKKIM